MARTTFRKTLQERAKVMTVAHSRNPERFVHGAPVVKPFPREVWINKPLVPDYQKPTMESKWIPLGNEKQGLVRRSHGKLLTDRFLRTQTENLANLSTRKGASMDLCIFQKSGLKDLDRFRNSPRVQNDTDSSNQPLKTQTNHFSFVLTPPP